MKPCTVTDNPSFAAKCIMGEAKRWHDENPEGLGKSPVVIVLVSNTQGTGLELNVEGDPKWNAGRWPEQMEAAQREDLARALRSLVELFEGRFT